MVFLFILFVLFLIFFIFLIISGKIVIEIYNLNIVSRFKKHIDDNYKLIFKIKIFNKITIFKKIFDNKKMNNLKRINKIKDINFNKIMKKQSINKDIIKFFVKDMIEIINIDIQINLGTKNAAITAILVSIVSTIISILFGLKIKNIKDQYFNINPLYTNENVFSIDINGIVAIKLIHIINIIYILLKEKGERKNDRTSNRKSYGYSYE